MKKLAKPLILLLVVSLLAGAFIFSALAEDASSTSAVGSYTQPEGSWTPGEDHTGIVFGVWAAEADFLAGDAPDYWYTDGELAGDAYADKTFTGARIGTSDANGTTYGVEGFIPGYVHCFGDVTNNLAQIYTGKQQTLVINLAGHTLANAKGFRIGSVSGATTTASVTFKNGTINHTGGQMQTRGNATLIYDNVVYNHTGGQILYDDGCDLLEFRNSTLTSTRADTVLDISPVSYGGDSEVRFVNTDLVFTVAQTASLFRFQSPFGPGVQNKSASVFFDKDSSLTRTGANLIALNHGWYDYANKDDDGDGVFGTYTAVQTVTFELGFTYSEDSIPTVFDRQYYNRSTGKYSAVKTTEEAAVGADNWLVINVVNGEETVTDYMMYLKGGMYELVKAPTPEDAWQPTEEYAGIKYGAWASELDYLLGKAPIYWSTSANLDTDKIATDSTSGSNDAYLVDYIIGYVHCYDNVTNTTKLITLGTKQYLIINLNGYSITDSKGYRVVRTQTASPDAGLEIRNGNYTKTGGTFQLRPNTTLVLDNLNLTYSAGGEFIAAQASLIHIKNCDITFTKPSYIDLIGSVDSNAGDRQKLIFENTSITGDGQESNTYGMGFLRFKEQAYNYNARWDVTFDAKSSISGNYPIFAYAAEGTAAGSDTAKFIYKQTITFEDGFAASFATYPTTYKFLATGAEATDVAFSAENIINLIANGTPATPHVHTPGEAVEENIVAPQCGVAGSYDEVVYCTDPECGEELSRTKKETPALEHDFDANNECKNCGMVVTPWTPAEGSGVIYGIWASELDYLLGNEPITPSTSDVLAITEAANTTVYVHCFANIKVSSQINIAKGQKLIIDLGGNTMTQTIKFQIGLNSYESFAGATLNVKNGNWTSDGQIQGRLDSALILENVNLTRSKELFFEYGATYAKYTNCTITTSAGYFKFQHATAERVQLIFENTDIIFTSATPALFQFFNNKPTVDITFDGDSSVQGTVTSWYSVAATLNDGAVTINFADGFALTAGTALPENATGITVTAGEIKYICVEHTPGDEVTSDIVEATCTTGGSYKSTVSCTVCGTVISSTTVETPALGHNIVDNVCTNGCGIVVTPWTPDKEGNTKDYTGITYGVWASELDYLLGNEPVSFSTSDVLAMPAGSAYVHCFADIKVSSDVAVASGEEVVLNLGGKTLAQSKKIQITANATLTVKNGNWTHTGGQNQGRRGSTLIVDNVNMTRDSGDFGFQYGTEYIRFTNCTINTANANFVFGDTTNDKTLVFENTDVILTGTRTNALFSFLVAKNVNITFDGNSSIVGDVGTWYTGADILGDSAVTINFEDGFTLNAGVALPENATGVTVNAGEIKYLCEIHSFGKDENGDTACTVCGTEPFKPEAGTTYIIWSTGLDYLKGIAPYLVSTDAEITGNADGVLSNVPNGAKIVLYADVTAGTIHTFQDYSLTIDLNGHKLTFTTATNMQLGYDSSGSWKERQITFTSSNGRGTIDATKRTGNTFQARPGSVVLFENLDITIGGNLFNDGGAKSITMRNCTLTGKNFANSSGIGGGLGVTRFDERTYTFDNTELYGVTVVLNYPNVIDNLTINFMNGCILDNAYANMFQFGNGTVNAQGTKKVNISADTKFTNFNLDLVKVIGTDATVTLNVLDGETPVTDYAVWSSGEYYVIGDKTTVTGFSANLTLYSDFNLNFFGADNIVGVYYNGALLESMSYEDKTKYTLKGITPDTAADTLKFIVAVQVGEEICYMPLNYSVLKYAEKAVGDGTVVNTGTQLVSAVMNYVKAAYVYTGKAAPEFTGVAYDVAVTAPTGFAHGAISGVQLVLGTEIGVRFNLDASYNGTVKIGDATYEVVNGEIAEGVNYVVYNARAYQFANGGIAVADAETTAVYTLADYVAWAKTTEDTNLVNLVKALYEYSYLANEYKNN